MKENPTAQIFKAHLRRKEAPPSNFLRKRSVRGFLLPPRNLYKAYYGEGGDYERAAQNIQHVPALAHEPEECCR